MTNHAKPKQYPKNVIRNADTLVLEVFLDFSPHENAKSPLRASGNFKLKYESNSIEIESHFCETSI